MGMGMGLGFGWGWGLKWSYRSIFRWLTFIPAAPDAVRFLYGTDSYITSRGAAAEPGLHAVHPWHSWHPWRQTENMIPRHLGEAISLIELDRPVGILPSSPSIETHIHVRNVAPSASTLQSTTSQLLSSSSHDQRQFLRQVRQIPHLPFIPRCCRTSDRWPRKAHDNQAYPRSSHHASVDMPETCHR